MEVLLLTSRTMPRAIVIIANVITKDWIRSRAVPAPLTNPKTPQTTMQIGTMSTGLIEKSVSSRADVVPPTARREPTDRSMPAVMMTRVIPMARIPRGAK